MRKVALIVPCYQEARRFDESGFVALGGLPDVTLVLADDGSSDDTRSCLERIAARDDVDAQVLAFPQNRGKGETVRDGLRHALASGAEIVGYADADMATPAAEIGRLLETLDETGRSVVLGSRIRRLGARIERSALRHYGARVYATAFSLMLHVPVYDTQCGAKVFRRTAALEAALAEPFVARWCFDVELLGRILIGTPQQPGLPLDAILELPLREWRDVPGSKFRGLLDAPRVTSETVRIALDLAARRRRLRQG
jgi:glycosyltransferase involved in cell wall biosynthesis